MPASQDPKSSIPVVVVALAIGFILFVVSLLVYGFSIPWYF